MFKSIFKRNVTEYIDTLILLLESWKCGSISGSMYVSYTFISLSDLHIQFFTFRHIKLKV